MSRFIVLAVSGMLVSFAPAAPAMAHDGLQHLCHDTNNNPVNDINQCCYDPSTGGQTNVEGYPYCPAYLDRVAGGEQYSTLDRNTLAHTHLCTDGNCGQAAQLSNVKPFYGSTGSPAPLPTSTILSIAQDVIVPAVAPGPVVVSAPVAAVAAPATYSAVPFSSAGLSTAGLAAVGLGVAAVIGVAAFGASNSDDDDNDATPSTN